MVSGVPSHKKQDMFILFSRVNIDLVDLVGRFQPYLEVLGVS